ncbi:ABC transporter permease [Allopusillimonas ginsengisoli]|uniref:ABC transporter permease n=1 Tax=Allopusillimonas ginsengisoli TaxID=453575 RepID=UPI00101FE910|nr:ABC transporter permease [Allopusillimonas ginsengisoli]TEA78023.1 ABC transporter permease [Allopusillimonas ginsengisoli]
MALKQLFRFERLSWCMVVLPTIAAVLYYAVLSVDRYVSSAQIVVLQAGTDSVGKFAGLAPAVAVGAGPALRSETLYLREHIVSNDMLAVLEDKLQWRAHFAAQRRDPLIWINHDDARERTLRFYRRMVRAHYDETTGLLTVTVQALTPAFAEKTMHVILKESERFMDRLSQALVHAQVVFAQSELKHSRHRYDQGRQALVAFQSLHGLLDGQAVAESRASIINLLETDRAKAYATLNTLRGALDDNTPQVQQQQRRIQALDRQIHAEKTILSSESPKGDALNVIADQYRDLRHELQMAEEGYKAATIAASTARIEAGRKIRSLIVVVSPNTPEEPLYPARLHDLFTIFVCLLLAYGVVRFVVAAVEDHRD